MSDQEQADVESIYFLETEEDRNDNALATRFVDENEGRVRYVPEWNKWLVWDGKRWKIDFQNVHVQGLARAFVDCLWSQVIPIAQKDIERGTLEKIRTFIRACNEQKRIANILTLARSDNRIVIHFEKLNSNPYLLNLDNGTYDLENAEFRKHDPEDNNTQLAPVIYDPTAECPEWANAMQLIFNGNHELIEFVQKAIGYSMSGDTGEHILLLCYGKGENGKSTVWNPLVEIFGEYAALANDSLILGSTKEHATEKASLYGKRFVAISEPEQNAPLKEARVKELTGDDWITARRMREDFWTFKRTHTLWLSTNHLPEIKGNDHGIWRRIRLIPFEVKIADVVTPRKNFVRDLVRQEASGIVNWAITGYHLYKLAGLEEPEAIKQATEAYRNESNELGEWIQDCCVTGKHVYGEANELFKSFKEWRGNSVFLTQTKFGLMLSSQFKKGRKTVSGKKKTVYEGIGLASDGGILTYHENTEKDGENW